VKVERRVDVQEKTKASNAWVLEVMHQLKVCDEQAACCHLCTYILATVMLRCLTVMYVLTYWQLSCYGAVMYLHTGTLSCYGHAYGHAYGPYSLVNTKHFAAQVH
jgi:hypothetical protein